MMTQDKYQEVMNTVQDIDDLYTVINLHLILERLDENNQYPEITCKYDTEKVINYLTDYENGMDVATPHVLTNKELIEIEEVLCNVGLVEIY